LISSFFCLTKIKVSSGDLQRFLFGEQYSFFEQEHSTEPTPSKRLKQTNALDENDEVSLVLFLKYPDKEKDIPLSTVIYL